MIHLNERRIATHKLLHDQHTDILISLPLLATATTSSDKIFSGEVACCFGVKVGMDSMLVILSLVPRSSYFDQLARDIL